MKSFFGGRAPAPVPVVPAEPANLSPTTTTGCFVAGTEVLMGDGSSKPIEDVVVGDEVLAWNAITGANEPKRVVETFVHEDIETWEVETTDGVVTTTAEHPFYVEGSGWTPAKDLRPGDALATADGMVEVVRVEPTGDPARVFNFHVEDLHNYHVASAKGSWPRVHNSCSGELAYNHPYEYHPRIRARALEDPRAHNFPYSFDDVILREKPTLQEGASLLFEKEGYVNGSLGKYQIAVNPDTKVIFHRAWKGNK